MPKSKANSKSLSKFLPVGDSDHTTRSTAKTAGKYDLKLMSNANVKDPGLFSKELECLDDPTSGYIYFTDETLDLKWLAVIENVNKDVKGNKLWTFWNRDEFVDKWDILPCNHYNESCSKTEEPMSFETMIENLCKSCGSWESFNENINFALNPTKLGHKIRGSDSAQWQVRKLSMALAQQDPLLVFGFDEPAIDGLVTNRYWDKSIERNPELLIHARPLAMFWFLVLAKMGHPLTDSVHFEVLEAYNRLLEEHGPQPDSEASEEEEEQSSPNKRTNQSSPDRQVRKNAKRLAVPNGDPDADKDDIDFDDQIQEANASTGSTLNNLTPNSISNSESARDDSVDVVETLAVGGETVGDVDAGVSGATGDLNESVASPPKTTKTAKLTQFSPQAKSTRFSPDASVRPETYTEAASLPPSVSSDEQLIEKLMQPGMYGMWWEMVHIYAVACNLNWLGTDVEQAAQDRKNKSIRLSIEDRMAKAIRFAITDAMKQCTSEYKLALLPISDAKYRDKELWIRSPKQVEKKLTSWVSLSNYLDRTGSQNVGYVLKKPEDAKERRLRTRMCFGFDKATPEARRSILNDHFNYHCSGGVYDTPLPNVGSIMQPGSFPYYSTMIDKQAFAHQLMLLTRFKCPIVVEDCWLSDLAFGKSDDTWRYGDNVQTPHLTCWKYSLGALSWNSLVEVFRHVQSDKRTIVRFVRLSRDSFWSTINKESGIWILMESEFQCKNEWSGRGSQRTCERFPTTGNSSCRFCTGLSRLHCQSSKVGKFLFPVVFILCKQQV